MTCMNETKILASGLSFSYGEKHVIKDISFSIPTGAITTIIGANGCGKSTLFSLLTKQNRPSAGKITLDGNEVEKMHKRQFAKKVACVHQYNTAPIDFTVEKLVEYGRVPYQCFGQSSNKKEDQRMVDWAIQVTNLEDMRNEEVTSLSGGQMQRVWIAMALAQGTDVLFLDEPTTYLDIYHQIELLKLIQSLQKEYNMTVVMILHDVNQALHYSDHIIAIKDGVVLKEGKPEEVITSSLVEAVYGIQLAVAEYDGKPFVLTV